MPVLQEVTALRITDQVCSLEPVGTSVGEHSFQWTQTQVCSRVRGRRGEGGEGVGHLKIVWTDSSSWPLPSAEAKISDSGLRCSVQDLNPVQSAHSLQALDVSWEPNEPRPSFIHDVTLVKRPPGFLKATSRRYGVLISIYLKTFWESRLKNVALEQNQQDEVSGECHENKIK